MSDPEVSTPEANKNTYTIRVAVSKNEEIARSHVIAQDLEAAYREMASDEDRETVALEWSEGLVGDVVDEPQ